MSETPSSPEPHRPDEPAPETPTVESRAGEGSARPRRLLRSRDDRVIGGVCGGLARYFGIDPLIVRIATVALVFVGGAAIIAYVAALAFVPEDDGTGNPATDRPSRTTTLVGAGVIILVGLVLATDGWWGFGWFFGPLIPITIVVGLLAFAGRQLLRDRGDVRPTAGRIAGATLILLAVLAASAVAFVGAAWATAAGGGLAIAGIVIALGVAMIALAFRGDNRRARWLVLPALVLAIPAGVVAAADIDVDGGIGQRTYRPATALDLKQHYQLGIGELRLDLRHMQWPAERPVTLNVDVGVGHALVLVPAGVCVSAQNHTGIGYVDVLGDDAGGVDVDYDAGTVARTTAKRLVLKGDMGIGAVEVLHSELGRDLGDRAGRDTITGDLATAGCAGNPL
jgi:phage shock protein PspC (stress-responsive transcriptional regulator)